MLEFDKNKRLTSNIAEEILDSLITVDETNNKARKNVAFQAAKGHFDALSESNIDFPLDAFPKFISETVTDWHQSSNLPAEYFGLGVLMAASTALGNKIRLKINALWYETPMLYGAIIGPNGIGKSPVWSFALAPINEIQDEANMDHSVKMKDYALAVGERISQGGSSSGISEPMPDLLKLDKFSMEYLYEALYFNPKGILLFRDELKGWLMSMNQYRAGDDLQDYLEFWNNASKSRHLKSTRVNIQRVFVNIFGAIQPGLVKALASGENVSNGLFQRFLFAYPYEFSRKPYSEKEPDMDKLNEYSRIIKFLHNIPDYLKKAMNKFDISEFVPMNLAFDKGAKKAWVNYYNEISKQYNLCDDENVGGCLSKHDRYCARLALILRMMRYAEAEYKKEQDGWEEPQDIEQMRVEEQDVLNAIKLSRYFIHQSMRILDRVGNPLGELKMDHQAFYKSLPQQFTSAIAVDISNDLQDKIPRFKMGRSTVFKFLNDNTGTLFRKDLNGTFYKLITTE